MKRTIVWLLMILALASAPVPARAEFDAGKYQPTTQADLSKNSERNVGKKFRITEPFQFCGSDFCVQKQMKINTREYYCFTVGPLCLVRMYIKKDHPGAQAVLDLKKGDKVTIYGTFEQMGSTFKYMVVDHVVVEKKPATP
jgi:hypothetical protein